MAKKKLHWTQRPENKSKVKRRINKMIKAKTNGKTKTIKSLAEAIDAAKSGDTILVAPNTLKEPVNEVFRASKNSYVLICGTRTPIQDLSHESLCDKYMLVVNEVSNLRRELGVLQELENNLRAEKFYRNL